MSRPDIEAVRERFLRPIESSEPSQAIWAHLVFARNDLRALLDYVTDLEGAVANLKLMRTDDMNDLTLAKLEIERLSRKDAKPKKSVFPVFPSSGE